MEYSALSALQQHLSVYFVHSGAVSKDKKIRCKGSEFLLMAVGRIQKAIVMVGGT